MSFSDTDFKKIIKWSIEKDAYDIANMSKEEISNIKEINLSNLDIDYIPNEFFKLTNIESMYLSLNNIEKIKKTWYFSQ